MAVPVAVSMLTTAAGGALDAAAAVVSPKAVLSVALEAWGGRVDGDERLPLQVAGAVAAVTATARVAGERRGHEVAVVVVHLVAHKRRCNKPSSACAWCG